jgi:hypothetical protein
MLPFLSCFVFYSFVGTTTNNDNLSYHRHCSFVRTTTMTKAYTTTTITRSCSVEGRVVMYSHNPGKTKEKKERKEKYNEGGSLATHVVVACSQHKMSQHGNMLTRA